MKEFQRNRALALGCVLALALASCQTGAEDDAGREQVSLPENSSVTVYPIGMLGQPNAQVGKVVVMMLERGGLERVELGAHAYEGDAAAFSAFAAKQKIETDYALYGEYIGTPKRGVDEVRGVLVDAQGNVVWKETQKRGDKAFDRAKPKDPMSCTTLLVKRLSGPLHLKDPLRKDASKSKMEERMKRESGVPNRAELEAMKERAAMLRSAGSKATMVVAARPRRRRVLRRSRQVDRRCAERQPRS